ncbi:DUF1998 domain-containing protein [Pseudomonas sp. BMS12]|uniref:DUF1998 domain-containing protein n=1 Tax=Pseudomonas sp. BMS12 TaxID=1796033 RepID=UPI00083A3C13|nr:DUF1998 domain-containing protein [Pseudomonas sp. BMS12]
MSKQRAPVGSVRPSQLLWTYGPGALIDLPNISVVTMGIDSWEQDRCLPVQEKRLLAAVQKALGPQVQSLRLPPFSKSEVIDPTSAEAYVGVPVKPFPRWLRCVKCGMLAPFDSGLFELKENRYRPEATRFVHKGCKGSKGDQPPKDADAVPARFLLACKNGHLDDFPWLWFVHSGPHSCRGTLRFFESGASLQTENLWVKCDDCGLAKSMAHAFGSMGKENLPGCRGRHPHLNAFDGECDAEPRAVLLGATNTWFPISISALAIPQAKDSLGQLVEDGWKFFLDVESSEELAFVVKTLKKSGDLLGIEKHSVESIWTAIQSRIEGSEDSVNEDDIKGPEWQVLTDPNPVNDYPHFMSETVNAPYGFEGRIARVLLLKRLREVNALIGFTRVEAQDVGGDPDTGLGKAPLSSHKPEWVPANQVHGEGIFIQFDEQSIAEWESRPAVLALNQRLLLGHRLWRTKRRIAAPDEGYPGARYVLLHTLAHLLIREMALECGYNAASIRERVYASATGEDNQAGIIIYTAAADSDGTLGGLVELGKPENLERLLVQALRRARICSSDPLCSEHDPQKDGKLHGAACHACSLVPETSCERGNGYLDRAMVVETVKNADAAYFKSF